MKCNKCQAEVEEPITTVFNEFYCWICAEELELIIVDETEEGDERDED